MKMNWKLIHIDKFHILRCWLLAAPSKLKLNRMNTCTLLTWYLWSICGLVDIYKIKVWILSIVYFLLLIFDHWFHDRNYSFMNLNCINSLTYRRPAFCTLIINITSYQMKEMVPEYFTFTWHQSIFNWPDNKIINNN